MCRSLNAADMLFSLCLMFTKYSPLQQWDLVYCAQSAWEVKTWWLHPLMWSPGTPREDAGGMRAVKDEKKMWKGTHGGPFKGQTMPAYCRKLKKKLCKEHRRTCCHPDTKASRIHGGRSSAAIKAAVLSFRSQTVNVTRHGAFCLTECEGVFLTFIPFACSEQSFG